MRMRTLPETARILKKEDPNTAITLTALRRLVKEKRIPVAWMTKKKPLVDVDRLDEFIYSACPNVAAPTSAGIHRIPE